jgi:hypothetical protein
MLSKELKQSLIENRDEILLMLEDGDFPVEVYNTSDYVIIYDRDNLNLLLDDNNALP